MALSCRKGSWLENHGAFLQERTMVAELPEFRSGPSISNEPLAPGLVQKFVENHEGFFVSHCFR